MARLWCRRAQVRIRAWPPTDRQTLCQPSGKQSCPNLEKLRQRKESDRLCFSCDMPKKPLSPYRQPLRSLRYEKRFLSNLYLRYTSVWMIFVAFLFVNMLTVSSPLVSGYLLVMRRVGWCSWKQSCWLTNMHWCISSKILTIYFITFPFRDEDGASWIPLYMY